MAAKGFKIVCIIEYDGAVYNPNGLDIAALAKHRKVTRPLAAEALASLNEAGE